MRNYIRIPMVIITFFAANAAFSQTSIPVDKSSSAYALKACGTGDALACSLMGLRYESGLDGVTQDKAKAALYHDKACKGAISSSCMSLASMYQEGEGVTKSMANAISRYEKACTFGTTYGCQALGIIYGYGQGVKQDMPKAIAFLKQAIALDSENWAAIERLKEFEQSK
jgi:uncharacterized protein